MAWAMGVALAPKAEEVDEGKDCEADDDEGKDPKADEKAGGSSSANKLKPSTSPTTTPKRCRNPGNNLENITSKNAIVSKIWC